jgi:hypothetical protein
MSNPQIEAHVFRRNWAFATPPYYSSYLLKGIGSILNPTLQLNCIKENWAFCPTSQLHPMFVKAY